MALLKKIKETASRLKKQIRILFFAYQDRNLPLLPRILAIITVAYALSPLDLIPDFIPLLGYLDDLILLPALIALTIRLIPAEILEKARARSEEEESTPGKNIWAALFIILLWAALLLAVMKAILT